MKRDQKGAVASSAAAVRLAGRSPRTDRLSPRSERKALLAMRRMQKAGKSLRDIATAMQERGFTISHQGVKKALARVGEVV